MSFKPFTAIETLYYSYSLLSYRNTFWSFISLPERKRPCVTKPYLMGISFEIILEFIIAKINGKRYIIYNNY